MQRMLSLLSQAIVQTSSDIQLATMEHIPPQARELHTSDSLSLSSAPGSLHFEVTPFTVIGVSSNNQGHLVIKTLMEF